MEYPSQRREYLGLSQKVTNTKDYTNLLMNRKFFKLWKIFKLVYKTHYRKDTQNSTEEGKNRGFKSPNMSENVQWIESKMSNF